MADSSNMGAELRQNYDFAYELITRELPAKKPELFIGSEHIDKFYHINSMKSLLHANSLPIMYSGELNGIYVSDYLADSVSTERIYNLLVVLGHAAIEEVNPEFSEERLERLMRRRKTAEKGYVYSAMKKGLSYAITLLCCANSGEPELEQRADKDSKHLDWMIQDWAESDYISLMAQREWMQKNPLEEKYYPREFPNGIDWVGLTLDYLSEEPAMLAPSGLEFPLTHRFLSHTGDIHLLESGDAAFLGIIMNPPESLRELLYPKEYEKRIKQKLSDYGLI